MKNLLASLLCLWFASAAFGQASSQVRTLASKADLVARVPVVGERVVVSYDYGARTFTAVSSLPAGGTNVAHVFASGATNKWWVSDDRDNPVQDIRYWGAIPDDAGDDAVAIQAAMDSADDNQIVFVPGGTWRLYSTLYLNTDYSSFKGIGYKSNLQVWHTGHGIANLGVLDGGVRRYGTKIDSVRITSGTGFSPSNALHMVDVSYHEIKSVFVTGGAGPGFNHAYYTFGNYEALSTTYWGGNWGNLLQNCTFYNRAGGGYVVYGDGGPQLHSSGPNDLRIIDCYIGGALGGSASNGAAGAIYLAHANMCRLIGNTLEHFSTNGIHLGEYTQNFTIIGTRFEHQGGTLADRQCIIFDEYESPTYPAPHTLIGNYYTGQGSAGSVARLEGPGGSKRIQATVLDPSFGGPGQLFASTWLVGTNLDGVFRDYSPFGNRLFVMDRSLASTNILGLAVIDGTNNPRAALVLKDSGDGTGTNSRVNLEAGSSVSSIPLYFIGSRTNAVITTTGSSILGMPESGLEFTVYGNIGGGPSPRNASQEGYATMNRGAFMRSEDYGDEIGFHAQIVDGVTNRRVKLSVKQDRVVLSDGLSTGGSRIDFVAGGSNVVTLTESSVTIKTNLVVEDGASISLGGVARTSWPSGSGGTNSSRVFWGGAEVADPNFVSSATVERVAPASTTNLAFQVADASITSNKLASATITPDKLTALTSADLRGKVSDESGTGVLLFGGGDIGAATATTPSADDNDTSVATTAFYQAEEAALKAANLWQSTNATLTRFAGIGSGTSGDVIYRDATGWTNLAKGSDGQVLKLSSGLPAWGTDSTGGGGGGDVYTTSNNVFTATNAFTKSLLISNTVENHEIVFVGTNATAGTTKNAGHIGLWDNGDAFGALRLAATDGHLRLQVTSTNLEAHTGFNFTNAPISQWIVHRDASGNGETYQEGRGPNMSTASDMSEYYRLRMKAIGFHLMTGKGGIEFVPTSGLVRIQGPGTAFVAPGSGAGIEFFYDSTNTLWGSGGAGRGGISVYSRDTSTFGDLRFNARQTRIQNSSTDALIITNSLVIVTNAALRVGPTNVTDELALKAPLASPALTGNPTAPTATAGDNDTSVATTAFVTAAVAVGTTNYPAGKTVAFFTAPQAHAPASNPASYGTRNAIPVLEFDPSTQEQSRWVINLPVGYAASTATIVLRWTTTATSGDGRMGARFWRVTGVDVDTDDFATAVEATTTCSATAGTTVSTTLSAVNLDGLVGGEVGILEVYRDTGDAADSINSNDIQLMSVEVRAE